MSLLDNYNWDSGHWVKWSQDIPLNDHFAQQQILVPVVVVKRSLSCNILGITVWFYFCGVFCCSSSFKGWLESPLMNSLKTKQNKSRRPRFLIFCCSCNQSSRMLHVRIKRWKVPWISVGTIKHLLNSHPEINRIWNCFSIWEVMMITHYRSNIKNLPMGLLDQWKSFGKIWNS